MPFITQEDREKIDNLTHPQVAVLLQFDCPDIFDRKAHPDMPNITVGDKCYYFYRAMVELWRKERRWTTAHMIYQDMIEEIKDNKHYWAEDTKRAYELAWQVFFAREVMKYEEEKALENCEV